MNDWYGEQEQRPDLRHYLQILSKRKWMILAVVVTVLAAVAVQTLTTTLLYKSTVKIQIDPEQANILPYKEVYEPSQGFYANQYYLNTQYDILKSKTLARRVVHRLQLSQNPVFNTAPSPGVLVAEMNQATSKLKGLMQSAKRPPAGAGKATAGEVALEAESRAAGRLAGSLEVEPIRGSQLVEVSYVSHDPRFAASIVNALAEEFIELHFERKFDATRKATDFLERQLTDLKIKVEQSEEQLLDYSRNNGLLKIEDAESITLQRLVELNTRLAEAETEAMMKGAFYESIKNATVEDFPPALKNPTIVSLENKKFEIEQSLARAATQFGPEWPEIVRLQREAAEIESQAALQKEKAIQQARIDYQVAVERQRRLQQMFEEEKLSANVLRQDSIQYNILRREAETNKQLYEGLLQRLKEAGVSAGLRSSNIQVVDSGEVPLSPFHPQATRNLGMGLLASLMMGVGLAFLMERVDNTLKTPEDIERHTGLPSLGVIPTRAGIHPGQGAEFQLKAAEMSDEMEVLPALRTRSRVWESYRSLRTSLLLSHSGRPPRTILVTSALPGEGKTTTVANTGIALAQTGARTLIVDLDMRKPTLGKLFGLSRDQGMSLFLSGNSDLSSQIRQTNVPNLFVIAAGISPPNPAELIGSARMDHALRLLPEYFKYIVFDSPPLLSVTDALVLSARVDGVLLVVQGGKTPREAVKKAKAHLWSVGAEILGAMLNNVDIQSSKYYYYYRYYYDYNYYGEKEESA